MSDITFSMIKPDAYAAGHTGAILAEIEKAGFRIRAMRLTRLSAAEAGAFYAIHRKRPFYEDLCSYMSSGPIVALLLEKEDAVNSYRKLMGATDPQKADSGTIRARFATSIEANAVHGADSNENAITEVSFFFSERDRLLTAPS